MKRLPFRLLFLASFLPTFLLTGWAEDSGSKSQSTLNLYLSPQGDDAAEGSRSAPLRTLAGARNRVRELSAAEPEANITVYLRAGRHEIRETVVLGLEDSANPGTTITYRNYPDEQPYLSGGMVVEGWRKTQRNGNVWVAEIPEGLHPLTLYEGKALLPRARGKGFIPVRQYDSWHGPQKDTIEFPKGALRNYPDSAHAEIVARTSAAWAMNIFPVVAIDEKAGTAQVRPGSYSLGRVRHRIPPPDSMWIENVLDELDEPGEWVVHPEEQKLYYWPLEGLSPKWVILPLVTELVRVEGGIDLAGPHDQPVRGIHFEGLNFLHADRIPLPEDSNGWSLQHAWDYFDAPNAALRFRGAEDCSVRFCEFTAAGGNGIRLDLHAQRIVITDSIFHNLGGAAAVFAGYGLGTKDVNKNNVFQRNHVFETGRIKFDRPALMIWQSGHNRIQQNLFHDTPYTAITLSCRAAIAGKGEGWRSRRDAEITGDIRVGGRIFSDYDGWSKRERFLHARDNLIEGNEIFSVMQVMGDGNGIYVSGAGGGNIIKRNHIHNVWSDHMGAPIRCDDDQHETLVEENVVENMISGGAGINSKGRNDIINNVMANLFVEPTQHHYGMLSFVTYQPDGSTIERNILTTPEPDQTNPVFARNARVLAGITSTVQIEEPIDLARSTLRDNLYWSPIRPTVFPFELLQPSPGWRGDWSITAQSGVVALGGENLSEINSSNGSGHLFQSGHWVLMERAFEEGQTDSGIIHLSFVLRRSENELRSQQAGIFLPPAEGTGGKGLFIGVAGNQFGVGTVSGRLDLSRKQGSGGNRAERISAKINLDEGSLTIRRTLLGPAKGPKEMEFSVELEDIPLLANTIQLRLVGGSNNSRIEVDEILIARDWNDDDFRTAVETATTPPSGSIWREDFLFAERSQPPLWGQAYLDAAHTNGYEQGSRVADPLFLDPGSGDFRFAANSPALAMGIRPLDTSIMGLRRIQWPDALAKASVAHENGAREEAALAKQAFFSRRHESASGEGESGQTDLRYIP